MTLRGRRDLGKKKIIDYLPRYSVERTSRGFRFVVVVSSRKSIRSRVFNESRCATTFHVLCRLDFAFSPSVLRLKPRTYLNVLYGIHPISRFVLTLVFYYYYFIRAETVKCNFVSGVFNYSIRFENEIIDIRSTRVYDGSFSPAHIYKLYIRLTRS